MHRSSDAALLESAALSRFDTPTQEPSHTKGAGKPQGGQGARDVRQIRIEITINTDTTINNRNRVKSIGVINFIESIATEIKLRINDWGATFKLNRSGRTGKVTDGSDHVSFQITRIYGSACIGQIDWRDTIPPIPILQRVSRSGDKGSARDFCVIARDCPSVHKRPELDCVGW